MIVIDDLIKQAMKSRNQTELRAYKNLKAELQIVQTAKNAKPCTENIIIQLISKMCKKLEDCISSFIEANREDLALEYRDELEVLKKLLPEPVNESQICSFVESDEIFFDKFWTTLENENDPSWQNGEEGTHMELHIPKKEMGNAIKYLKSKFPQVDGKIISEVVKKYIV